MYLNTFTFISPPPVLSSFAIFLPVLQQTPGEKIDQRPGGKRG